MNTASGFARLNGWWHDRPFPKSQGRADAALFSTAAISGIFVLSLLVSL